MAQVKKTIKKVDKKAVKPAETNVKKTAEKKIERMNSNKLITGKVVSTKMQKTVIVAIERKVPHKLYGKLIKVTKRLKADSNGMEINEGDTVVIEMTKPISRDKNFKVIKKEGAK